MDSNSHNGFVWKIAICSSIAYLCATIPQVLIDPTLKHHIKFPGGREYPLALYFIIPIGIAVFLLTFIILKKRPQKILYPILPFLIAVILSVPIFAPEMPHGNLLTVSCVWLVMAILTLWIRGRKIHFDDLNILMSGDFGDKAAKIEYLKEESQFWRMIHVGLAGGYFAIIISWGNFFMILNKTIVAGNEAEAFTLNNATFGLMGITTIALIVCPLSEAFKRHRETAQLFLQIQKEES